MVVVIDGIFLTVSGGLLRRNWRRETAAGKGRDECTAARSSRARRYRGLAHRPDHRAVLGQSDLSHGNVTVPFVQGAVPGGSRLV